jgi:hypothetical protein
MMVAVEALGIIDPLHSLDPMLWHCLPIMNITQHRIQANRDHSESHNQQYHDDHLLGAKNCQRCTVVVNGFR